MTVEEEVQVLREIARFPDDFAMREIWAGLLERRGERARATLIREQLARRVKQLSSPTSRTFESATERGLLAVNPAWANELATLGVARGELSGGLVESIVIDAGTLVAKAREIMDRAPVRRVHLTGDVTLVPKLARDGVFERVIWLELSGLRVDASLLASLEGLTGLRALGLANSGVTNAMVETIWASFPTLLLCNLDRNPCSDLVTSELTHQEMSTSEWVMTDHAVALEKKHGRRRWLYPSSWPGADRPDLELVLARSARGW